MKIKEWYEIPVNYFDYSLYETKSEDETWTFQITDCGLGSICPVSLSMWALKYRESGPYYLFEDKRWFNTINEAKEYVEKL